MSTFDRFLSRCVSDCVNGESDTPIADIVSLQCETCGWWCRKGATVCPSCLNDPRRCTPSPEHPCQHEPACSPEDE